MQPLELAVQSFAKGDDDAARWLYLVAEAIRQGAVPANAVDGIVTGRLLNGEAWAEACGADFRGIPLEHLFRPPELLDSLPQSWRNAVEYSREEYVRGGYIVRASDAKIVFWNWGAPQSRLDELFFIMSSKGDMVEDDEYWLQFKVRNDFVKFFNSKNKKVLMNFRGIPSKKISGPHIFLGSRRNYTHFLLNFVAKTYYFHDDSALSKLPIICGPLLDYQIEMLNLMGIPNERIVQVGGADIRCMTIETDELVIPSGIPWVLASRFVGERMTRDVDIPDMPEMRRVYFSRQNLAPRHRVSNETEVQEFLTARGFTIIHPEKLSVTETIRIMRNADIVVMVGGAAHGNCAFTKPGTKFIGLYPPAFGLEMPENLGRGGAGGHIAFADDTIVVVGRSADGSEADIEAPCHFDTAHIERALRTHETRVTG